MKEEEVRKEETRPKRRTRKTKEIQKTTNQYQYNTRSRTKNININTKNNNTNNTTSKTLRTEQNQKQTPKKQTKKQIESSKKQIKEKNTKERKTLVKRKRGRQIENKERIEEEERRRKHIKETMNQHLPSILNMLIGERNGGFQNRGIAEEDAKRYEAMLKDKSNLAGQLQATQELCSFYSMCQMPTYENGYMRVMGPLLMDIVKNTNYGDLILMAVRALTNMIDAVPEVSEMLIEEGILNALNAKLVNVQFIDVVEQCISCIALLAEHVPERLLESDTIEHMMMFMDFHAIMVQRKIMKIVSKLSIHADDGENKKAIIGAKENIMGVLNHVDEKMIEEGVVAAQFIVKWVDENIMTEKQIEKCLDIIAKYEANDTIMVATLKILGNAAQKSSKIAELLLEKKIYMNIQQLLQTHQKHTIHLLTLCYTILPSITMHKLAFRMEHEKQQALLREKITETDHNNTKMTSPTNTPTNLSTDSSTDTTTNEKDKKIQMRHIDIFLKDDRYIEFMRILLPEFMNIYQMSAHEKERKYAVTIIISIIMNSSPEMLKELLRTIPVSTFLKNLLSSIDIAMMSAAMDMVNALMEKLPEIYVNYFVREGVIAELERIRGCQVAELPTQTLLESLQQTYPKILAEAKQEHEIQLKKEEEERKKEKAALSKLKRRKRKSKKNQMEEEEDDDFRAPLRFFLRPKAFIPPTPKIEIPKGSRFASKDKGHFKSNVLLHYVLVQVDELLREHFDVNLPQSSAINTLTKLSSTLTAYLNSPSETNNERACLTEIRDTINAQDITRHEILESDIFETLAQYLESSQHNVDKFLAVFGQPFQVHSFSSSPYKHFTQVESYSHLREFMRKLQACLSSIEHLEVNEYQLSTLEIRRVFRTLKAPAQIEFEGEFEVPNIMVPPVIFVNRLQQYVATVISKRNVDGTMLDEALDVGSPIESESEGEAEEIIRLSREKNEGSLKQRIESKITSNSNTNIDPKTIEFYVGKQKINPHSSLLKELYKYDEKYVNERNPSHCSFHHETFKLHYKIVKPNEKESSNKMKDDSYSNELESCMSSKICEILRVLKVLQEQKLMIQEDFINQKLDTKFKKMVCTPFVATSGCISKEWETLVSNMPFLFSYEARELYFASLAVGSKRSLDWILQHAAKNKHISPFMNKLSQILRVIIDHKKVILDRQQIFSSAFDFFRNNDDSKGHHRLEFAFYDEVGTGLGPTMEFFTKCSTGFLDPTLKLWIEKDQNISVQNGLYPKPLSSSNSGEFEAAMFHFLGLFMARSLLDRRIVDLPLSPVMFCHLAGKKISFDHLKWIDRQLYDTLLRFKAIMDEKETIENNPSLSSSEKQTLKNRLLLDGATISDLCLTFTLPGYDIEIVEGGANIDVTIDNLGSYVDAISNFYLYDGVSKQMNAFRNGFSELIHPSLLFLFTTDEMSGLFCGNDDELWSIEALHRATICDHGFTHDSLVITQLFEILCSFSKEDRRLFLQFITGSPRLPIGGLKSLDPPFTIVRKVIDSSPDSYLPSVMTCTNYLKLPDYSSKSVLHQQLVKAMKLGQNAFHLS